jgi:branched-chain amino acid transport system permease protein
VMGIPRSVDALVMVLLGGVESLVGPVAGAAAFTWLQDEIARYTQYWRAIFGALILLLVVVFPQGLAGLGLLLRRVVTGRRRSGDAETSAAARA